MEKIKGLRERPEFYNTTTTNTVVHVGAIQEQTPLSWKMLLSGYVSELVYERGKLDRSLAYPDQRRQRLINERARAADGADDFSRRIRMGLPGILPS